MNGGAEEDDEERAVMGAGGMKAAAAADSELCGEKAGELITSVLLLSRSGLGKKPAPSPGNEALGLIIGLLDIPGRAKNAPSSFGWLTEGLGENAGLEGRGKKSAPLKGRVIDWLMLGEDGGEAEGRGKKSAPLKGRLIDWLMLGEKGSDDEGRGKKLAPLKGRLID